MEKMCQRKDSPRTKACEFALKRPIFTSFLVFVFLMVIVTLVARKDQLSAIAIKKAHLLQQLSSVRSRIEALVMANQAVLKAIRASIYNHPDIDKSSFQTLTAPFIDKTNPLNIRHIALAPGLKIK